MGGNVLSSPFLYWFLRVLFRPNIEADTRGKCHRVYQETGHTRTTRLLLPFWISHICRCLFKRTFKTILKREQLNTWNLQVQKDMTSKCSSSVSCIALYTFDIFVHILHSLKYLLIIINRHIAVHSLEAHTSELRLCQNIFCVRPAAVCRVLNWYHSI